MIEIRKMFTILAMSAGNIALVGCGGGGASSAPTPAPAPAPAPAPGVYTVGGTISGLGGSLEIVDNGTDSLSLSSPGSFSFQAAISAGSAYAVTIATQPPGQTCSISNGTGIATADVSTVAIACSSTSGTVSTVAGGAPTGPAHFYGPHGIATDSAGNVYIADELDNLVKKLTPDGTVSVLAGGGTPDADGVGTSAGFYDPAALAVDAAGNVYVAESGGERVRRITPAGVVTTIAGPGSSPGLCQDGSASVASFGAMRGISVDASGNLYVADFTCGKLRKIDPSGNVTTLAGGGSSNLADGLGAAANLNQILGLTMDGAGNFYVITESAIRMVSPIGLVTTISGAGGDEGGYLDGPVANARFNYPSALSIDASGAIYVADTNNYVIRRISNGTVSTLAGVAGVTGDSDGPAAQATFNYPEGIVVTNSGLIYIADTDNEVIRKITP